MVLFRNFLSKYLPRLIVVVRNMKGNDEICRMIIRIESYLGSGGNEMLAPRGPWG